MTTHLWSAGHNHVLPNSDQRAQSRSLEPLETPRALVFLPAPQLSSPQPVNQRSIHGTKFTFIRFTLISIHMYKWISFRVCNPSFFLYSIQLCNRYKTVRSIDWLIDLSICLFVCLLFVCLIDCLIDWLIDWLTVQTWLIVFPLEKKCVTRSCYIYMSFSSLSATSANKIKTTLPWRPGTLEALLKKQKKIPSNEKTTIRPFTRIIIIRGALSRPGGKLVTDDNDQNTPDALRADTTHTFSAVAAYDKYPAPPGASNTELSSLQSFTVLSREMRQEKRSWWEGKKEIPPGPSCEAQTGKVPYRGRKIKIIHESPHDRWRLDSAARAATNASIETSKDTTIYYLQRNRKKNISRPIPTVFDTVQCLT